MRRRRARGDREHREGAPRGGAGQRPHRGADHGPLASRERDGPRQIEIFEQEGVDLSRVQIAHTGDTDDLDYIERLLEKGVYIGMDRYGLEIFLPIERRNATVTALLERGYADRMFLSQDYCATIDWYPVEVEEQMLAAGVAKGWSMTLVFDEVIPALREAGMTDDQLETMMVENPKRWLGR